MKPNITMWKTRIKAAALGTIAAFSAVTPAHADDTEVFFGSIDPSLQIFPNVLFVLDTSGSMNWTDSGVDHTRLTRMKDALDIILNSATNVNIGIMRFNGSSGGGSVLYPLTYIDEPVCESGNCGEVHLLSRVQKSENDAEDPGAGLPSGINGTVLTLGVSSDGIQATGVRFEGIDIPSGATITNAEIEFVSQNNRSDSASFTIHGELTDSAAPFTTNVADIYGRTSTTETVAWTPGSWQTNKTYTTPSMVDVVQEIVDQAGWCGGNDMAFGFLGSGTRNAISYDNTPNSAPLLKISYDSTSIPTGMGCTRKTVIASVSHKNNDAEERLSNGDMYRTSSDLELIRDGNKKQLIGVRFKNLDIPQGADVLSAQLEFEVDKQKSGDVSLYIWGQDHDDAGHFKNNDDDISNRTKTTAQVDWDNLPNPAKNAKVRSPDVSSIVKEIVDRSGWSSNNDMVFIIGEKSGSGTREFESYDGEPTAAPKLIVELGVNVGASAEPVFITARDKMKQIITGLTATGGTPIVDSLYEAALYYKGLEVDYGTERGYSRNKYHRVSTPLSYTGGVVNRPSGCTDANPDSSDCKNETIGVSSTHGAPTYISPIDSSCQTNQIVLLSDGEPTSNSSVSKSQTMMGTSSCTQSGSEKCGNDLVGWLNNTDHAPGIPDKQNISTYTIGLNLNSPFLEGLATAGGGEYYQASTSGELANVFNQILGDVLDLETTFVAPGATVNQFNRLTHRSDIYFSLFKPSDTASWDGNLKKYRLALASDGVVRIHDSSTPAPGKLAIDTQTGYFADDVQSYWSASVDGNKVKEGGAASRQSLTNRKVYTYTGAAPSTPVNLNTAQNMLSENNKTNITKAHLGISGMSDSYHTDLLKWARGVDINDVDQDGSTTDVRKQMGDPMHSRPMIVNYGTATSTEPDSTIFVSTNEGFLHAVDFATGDERFAYIPKELLPNLDANFVNSSATSHPYGLDGSISMYLSDENDNGVVDGNEKAYLNMGMRRGGRNYYSMDVSDRDNPKLRWVIEGGTTGFEQLGQTWSKMVPTKVKIGSTERDVLIFAGGYDTNQDRDPNAVADPRKTDTIGRAIYIVDALTGVKIWTGRGAGSATGPGLHKFFTDMKYSIPSDIRVIDINFDGFADQLYVGDMGGQLWRFDINNLDPTAELVTGGVMADMAEDGELAKARKFFYEPDVALVSQKGKKYLTISVGSGWRSHPLNKDVNDEFYMIRTDDVYAAPAGYGKKVTTGTSTTYQKITTADLTDVTDDVNTTVDWSTKQGWRLRMVQPGEKVLARAVTINNQVVFSTYLPDLTVGGCDAAVGGGRAYAVDLLTGAPTLDLDPTEEDDGTTTGTDSSTEGSEELDEEDRHTDLTHGGIAPEPVVLRTDLGDPTIILGTEQPLDKFNFGNSTKRTYWIEPELTEEPVIVSDVEDPVGGGQ